MCVYCVVGIKGERVNPKILDALTLKHLTLGARVQIQYGRSTSDSSVYDLYIAAYKAHDANATPKHKFPQKSRFYSL